MLLQRTGNRILRDTAAVLDLTAYIAGVATAPDAAPAVVVTDASGATVASGNATIVGTASQFTMTPAETADVNVLTATWTASVGGIPGQIFETRHQIVGSLLSNLAEARAFDDGALTSVTDYPNDVITAARDRITDAFEDIIGAPVGLSYGREVIDGQNCRNLFLDGRRIQTVRAAATRISGQAAFVALTAGELADTFLLGSEIVRESLGYFTLGYQNVRVEYEHGYQPVPQELSWAGRILLRDQLVSKNYSSRATSLSDETGTYALSTAGVQQNMGSIRSFFGIPSVDEVLSRYAQANKIPAFA